MATWLTHLVLSSAGLLAAGLAAFLAGRMLRRDPVAHYRVLVAVLLGALALPPLQLAVEGSLPVALNAAARPTAAGAPTAAAPVPAEAATAHPAGAIVRAVAAVLLHPLSAAPDGAAPEARSSRLPLTSALLALYLAGLGATLSLQIIRVRRTGRWLKRCAPVTDPGILAAWEGAAAGSSVRARVRLVQSSELDAPACFGIFRPVLVVPSTSTPGAHLDWALRHELVHLERRDFGVALLQCVLTIAFWFHPASWWLARQLDQVRELSCDELVVGKTGRAKSYALALLAYAGAPPSPIESPSRFAPQLLHWSRSRSQLRRRIEMLAMLKNLPSRHRLWLAAGAIVPIGLIWSAQLGAAASFVASEPPSLGEQDRPGKRDAQLGITTLEIDEALASQLGVDAGDVLLVGDVAPDSPAARAGLQRFDVITQIGGESPVTRAGLRRAVQQNDGQISLRVLRKGRAQTVKVHFGGDDEAAPSGGRLQKQQKPGKRIQVRSSDDLSDEEKAEIEAKLKPALEKLGPRLERLGEDLERVLGSRLDNLGPQIESALQNLDLERLGPQIEKAVQDLDLERLGPQIEKAVRDLDLERLGPQIERAVRDLDLERLGPQIQKAVQDLDLERLGPQIEKAIKGLDLEGLGPDIQKMIKDLDLEHLGPEIQRAIEDAKRDHQDEGQSQPRPRKAARGGKTRII